MKDLLRTYKGLCKFGQLVLMFILPPIIYGGIVGNVLAIPLSTLTLFFIYKIKWNHPVFDILMLVCCYIFQKIMLEFSGISLKEGSILTVMKLAMFLLLVAREYLSCKIQDIVDINVISGHGEKYCNIEDSYPKCVGEWNHTSGRSYAEGFYVVKDGELEEVEKL